jgi:hypothetical protein
VRNKSTIANDLEQEGNLDDTSRREKHFQKYWRKRASEGLYWCLFLNTMNLYTEICSVISPRGEKSRACNLVYLVSSVIQYALCFIWFKKKEWKHSDFLIRVCLMMVQIRNMVRLLDIEGTKGVIYFDGNWEHLVFIQSIIGYISHDLQFTNFKNTCATRISVIILYGFSYFCVLVGIFGGVE